MKIIKVLLIVGFTVSLISPNYAQTKEYLNQTVLGVHEKQQNVGLAAVILREGNISAEDLRRVLLK